MNTLERDLRNVFLKVFWRSSFREILLEPVAGLVTRTWEGASASAAALTGAVWDATIERRSESKTWVSGRPLKSIESP